MRTVLKVTAGGLVGFLGNLVPSALPDKTVTVTDLIWATVTGLIVCLVVLGVTHARVWPRWEFVLQSPIRRPDSKVKLATNDLRRSVRTGPSRRAEPARRTTKQDPEHRHFLDDAVTTHRLLEQADALTTAELKAFVSERIGSWMHADGDVVDVWEKPECVEVSLTAPGFTWSEEMGRVIAHFDPEWRERAIRLPKSVAISLVGRIATIQPDIHIIDLEHCEIVTREPVTRKELSATAADPGGPHGGLDKTAPIAKGALPLVPVAAEDRVLVGPDITPEYLLGMISGHTAIQADRLIGPFIGKWMRVSGNVFQISALSNGGANVAFVVNLTDVISMSFDPPWSERLSILTKGSQLTVIGQIARVSSSLGIGLEHCDVPLDSRRAQ
jgi:hypothetical protein